MNLDEYFRTETNKKLDGIQLDVSETRKEIRGLAENYWKFKWQIMGGSAVVSAIVAALMLVIFGR